jgi:hypothetical protein
MWHPLHLSNLGPHGLLRGSFFFLHITDTTLLCILKESYRHHYCWFVTSEAVSVEDLNPPHTHTHTRTRTRTHAHTRARARAPTFARERLCEHAR